MRVRRVVTTRAGGRSVGPFARFNLSAGVGDDPVAVAANRRRLATELGLRGVVFLDQVHGTQVAVVDTVPRPGTPDRPGSDAAVTALPGVGVAVLTADCVPVLLADPRAGVVAAVHAGRPGMVAGVVPAAVAAMRSAGAADLHAWVGPHVCGACYEVPEQMRADVATVVPEAFAETSWGTPSVDVGAGVVAQLRAAGVGVVGASRCTREDENLFSYRRQGAASGRMAGIVWVRS